MNYTKLMLVLFHLPILAVAVHGFFLYKKLDFGLKLLANYLLGTGILYAISLFLWFLHINNLCILHVLVPLRFVCLVLIYKHILNGYVRGWVLYLLAAGFCIYSILNTLFWEPWNTFNSDAMTTESILMIILSLSTYVFLMDKRMTEHLRHFFRSVEWINAGVFIYYSSSLILMYFGVHIIQAINPELSRYTWIVHAILSVIMYYCFWRALWKRKTT